MNYTQHYQLPQWVETDRILMEDFNDAFDTIESAMAGFGNCQLWTTSYVGTGPGNQNSLILPEEPILVCVSRQDGPEVLFLTYGMGEAFSFGAQPAALRVYWEENNTVRWALDGGGSVDGQMNRLGDTYLVLVLLKNT